MLSFFSSLPHPKFEVSQVTPMVGERRVSFGQQCSQMAPRQHVAFDLQDQPPEYRGIRHAGASVLVTRRRALFETEHRPRRQQCLCRSEQAAGRAIDTVRT
jgi:hypothetical protein